MTYIGPEGEIIPFLTLGEGFADPVLAAPFPALTLRYRNNRAAADVGLDGLSDDQWCDHMGRFTPLPGNLPQPLALRYHGHQFRHYNPDLGDGRGFLFAQLRNKRDGRLMDLGTKGSGQTPWSRLGDGRLTLKGAVREVLATELLQARGVLTSQTLSVIETHEALERRDEPSPTRSAVLVRMSHSHIRFGTFQRLAYFEDIARLKRLCDYVVNTYPHPAHAIHARSGPATQVLAGAVQACAETLAGWMAAGFVHGVLNTDNMNITGESFDYGPYRFQASFNPGFVAAYFDHGGLYAYGRQPEAVFWNLNQLAHSLSLIAEPTVLSESLAAFEPAYHEALGKAFCRRLGVLPRASAENLELARAVTRLMASGGEALGFEPVLFDWFGGEQRVNQAHQGRRKAFYTAPDGLAFLKVLSAFEAAPFPTATAAYFERDEPEDLLIQEIEALWARIDEEDNWQPLFDKIFNISSLTNINLYG